MICVLKRNVVQINHGRHQGPIMERSERKKTKSEPVWRISNGCKEAAVYL